ncbi:unnamed protein product [Moneuplotes crassus]|uniref:Uncharacterized protein n=1 Tax=Euplotes crassus TaxID=5936 RepID=A0AAD1XCX2_EUPCR|nr:unnamed protein product [Moneuplotes crassus]
MSHFSPRSKLNRVKSEEIVYASPEEKAKSQIGISNILRSRIDKIVKKPKNSAYISGVCKNIPPEEPPLKKRRKNDDTVHLLSKYSGEAKALFEIRKNENYKIQMKHEKSKTIKNYLDYNTDVNKSVKLFPKISKPRKAKEQLKKVKSVSPERKYHTSKAAEEIYQKYLNNKKEEDFNKSKRNMNWLKTLTNQFKDSPTRKRINTFRIGKGKLIPNYSIHNKFSQTQFKSFMSLDYGDFAQPESLEQIIAEKEEQVKRTVDEEKAIEKRYNEVKANNTLFEDEADESDLSEVNDPLIKEGKKSTEFLQYKLKDFMLKASSFDKGNLPKFKKPVKPIDLFKKVKVRDPGDQWRNDLEWRNQSNPRYEELNKSISKKEMRMVHKRHHAHQLKALALGQDLKAFDRKIVRELKKKIF